MQQKNFEKFTTTNLGKEVIATVKDPKRVIKGRLTKEGDAFFIKNGVTTPIDHEKIKMIALVITKDELRRRRTIRYAMN